MAPLPPTPIRRGPSGVAACLGTGLAFWLTWGEPALASLFERPITRALTPGELMFSMAAWAVVITVFVMLCKVTWTYDLQHDGDRLLFLKKGDVIHKVQITALASVKLSRKGSGATFVEKDGTKYHTKDTLGPALMEALWKSGVEIEGRSKPA